MKNKRILALLLALCILAMPVLTACSGLEDLDKLLGSGNEGGGNESVDSARPVIPSIPSLPDVTDEDKPGSEDKPGESEPEDSYIPGDGEVSGSDTEDSDGHKPNMPDKDENVEIDEVSGLQFTLGPNEKYYSVSVVKPLKKAHIIIPSEYKGVPVTTIEKNAFSGCSGLETVSLPSSITQISAFSFYNCLGLKAILIPLGVKTVGSYAFDGCDSLSIYCEADSQPQKWDKKWNPDNRPVTWGFTCEHNWIDSTCTEPSYCSVCGIADGVALGHDIVDGACTRCDYEESKDDTTDSSDITDDSTVDSDDTTDSSDITDDSTVGSDDTTDSSDVTDGSTVDSDDTTDSSGSDGDDDNNDDIVIDGNNIANLADITVSDTWWAINPNHFVDGDLSTATLTSIRAPYTSFTFTWKEAYYFTYLRFFVNGQGSAPYAGVIFDGTTNNSFLFDVTLYDKNGSVVYEVKELSSKGVAEQIIAPDCVAEKMVFTVYGNYIYYPIFEVETYAYLYNDGCNHQWAEATCTEPMVCTLCGVVRGVALGHEWLDATCTEPMTCAICGATEGEIYLHRFENLVVIVEPTCTEEGYSVYQCLTCEMTERRDKTVPINHDFVDGACSMCGMKAGPSLTYASLSGDVWETANPNSDGRYTLRTKPKSSGGTVTLANGTVVDKEFYGWFDKYGNLYAPGTTITVDEDTCLYEAYGVTVYTAEDFRAAINCGLFNHVYVKLGADITLDSTLSPWGTIVLVDLNGHTLTSTAKEYAFSIQRGSFALMGEGEFVHNPVSVNYNAHMASVMFRRHGYGDAQYPQLFWIGKDVAFTTPYNALHVESVLLEKMPNIMIAGTVNAKGLAYITPVTTNALCTITKSASVTLSDDFITFADTTGTEIYMTVTIAGALVIENESPLFDNDVQDKISIVYHTHNWKSETCTTPKYCTLCLLESDAALGHSFYYKRTAPTCCSEGEEVQLCEYCDYYYVTVLPIIPDGHRYDSTVILYPTCVDTGITEDKCRYCGHTVSFTVDATGQHDYSLGVCKVCGHKRLMVLPNDIESITASHEGGGSGNLDKLFDGEKISSGMFSDGSSEYFPSAVGDFITIVLKDTVLAEKIVLWGCGNWTQLTVELFDEDGALTGSYTVTYDDGFDSAPSSIYLESGVNVKSIVITSIYLKWTTGRTQKTSEIEIFTKHDTHSYSVSEVISVPTYENAGEALLECPCGEAMNCSFPALCKHYLDGNTCQYCGAFVVDGVELALNKDGKSYSVVGFCSWNWSKTEIAIAAEYGGLPVTAVGDFAFLNLSERVNLPKDSFFTVFLPSTVTSVGDFAFALCDDINVTVRDANNNKLVEDEATTWAEQVCVGNGNSHFIDVVLSLRPAFGWNRYNFI